MLNKKNLLKVLHSAVLKIIVGVAVCAILPEVIMNFFPPRTKIIPPEWYSLLKLAIVLLSYSLLFWIWDRRRISELGFKQFGLNSAGAFLLGFGVICVYFLILYISGDYQIHGIKELGLLGGTILFFLMMSATEEVIMRGVLYRIAEEKIGTNLSLIISSFLFGILHLFNDNFNLISMISLVLGGLLLGLVYTNTRNLWAVIFAHLGWNFAQSFGGANVSGSSRLPKFLNAEFSGVEWITGGGFGPENSYITILLLVILVVYFYRRSKQHHKFVSFRRSVK